MENPMSVQTFVSGHLKELLEKSAYRGNAKARSLDSGLGETAVRQPAGTLAGTPSDALRVYWHGQGERYANTAQPGSLTLPATHKK
jgi:hypothetical protein